MSEPETDAIVAAYTTPPDQTRIDLIDAVVLRLKGTAATTGSVWDSLQALWVNAAPDAGSGKINWKSPGTFDQVWHQGAADGGLTQIPEFGVKGTGLGGTDSSYVNTQIDPTAGGLVFSQNDAGLFAFFTKAAGDAANDNYLSFHNSGNPSFAMTAWRSAAGNWSTRLFSPNTLGFNAAPNSRVGCRSVERVGTAVSGWIDGVFDSTKTQASAVPTNATIKLLGAAATLCSPDTLGASAIFRAIGAAGHVALYEAFVGFFTALGSWPPPPPAPPFFTGDAIDLSPASGTARARVMLKNVVVSDFQHMGLLDGDGAPQSGDATYALTYSDDIQSLFANGTGVVGLTPQDPFADPADYDPGDPTKWLVPTLVKNSSATDSTAAIQAALDSTTAEVVVLPPSLFYITDTLLIRSTVKKFLSIAGALRIKPSATLFGDPNNPRPMIRFTSTTTDCIIDGIQFSNAPTVTGGTGGAIMIEHASPRDLLIRDCANFQVTQKTGYRNTVAGTGKLFMDNTAMHQMEIKDQLMWARNLNLEATTAAGEAKFKNDGGEAWILGFKTELKGTCALTINGGKTEIYGGFFFPNQAYVSGDDPLFKIVDSDFSASWIEMVFTVGRAYQPLVVETLGAETRTLMKADVPQRGLGSAVMLYSNV